MRITCKKVFLILFAVMGLLFITFLIFIIWYKVPIAKMKYGVPELVYYSSQVLGVFITASAVVVALFGRELRSLFFKEKIEVVLTDSGICENLGDTIDSPNPQAQSYDCYVGFRNVGSKKIENLQLILKKVMYKENTDKKFKEQYNSVNKIIYWSNPGNLNTNLVEGEEKKILLYRIHSEDICQTPDKSESSFSGISIIGYSLKNEKRKKGIWQTTYQLMAEDKILRSFEITVQWDGVWCSRISEMQDKVNVQLNYIGNE